MNYSKVLKIIRKVIFLKIESVKLKWLTIDQN